MQGLGRQACVSRAASAVAMPELRLDLLASRALDFPASASACAVELTLSRDLVAQESPVEALNQASIDNPQRLLLKVLDQLQHVVVAGSPVKGEKKMLPFQTGHGGSPADRQPTCLNASPDADPACYEA